MRIIRTRLFVHRSTIAVGLGILASMTLGQISPSPGLYSGGGQNYNRTDYYGFPYAAMERYSEQRVDYDIAAGTFQITATSRSRWDLAIVGIDLLVCVSVVFFVAAGVETWCRREDKWKFTLIDLFVVTAAVAIIVLCCNIRAEFFGT